MAVTVVQLTLDQMVTADRSVYELRRAAERALADGRLQYGNELADLAEQLAALLLTRADRRYSGWYRA